jgi:hypothetical protein
MNLRSRTVLTIGLLVALAAAGLVIVDSLSSPPPGVTQGSFRRLKLGMTEEQCDAILCGPNVTKRVYFREYGHLVTDPNGGKDLQLVGPPVRGVDWQRPDGAFVSAEFSIYGKLKTVGAYYEEWGQCRSVEIIERGPFQAEPFLERARKWLFPVPPAPPGPRMALPPRPKWD